MLETKKEFKKFLNINPLKLTRYDLTKLIGEIEESFSEEDGKTKFEISTNYGHTNVKAKSANDFFKIKDLPEKLFEITISCYDGDKRIYLIFDQYSNRLSVYGNNETWVLGTFQKIKFFLNDRRPWFYSRKVFIFFIY